MRFSTAATVVTVTLAATAPAFVTPAFAGAATQAEANRIETALQGYFGKVPGVVSVAPEGDAYHLRVDLAPVLGKLPPEVKVTISPLDYMLTDQGGGLWGVKTENMPVKMSIVATDPKDGFKQDVSIAGISMNGTFDEKLGSFTRSSSDIEGLAMHQVQKMKGEPISDVSYTIDKIHTETQSSAAGDGLDLKMTQNATGISETFKISSPKGARPNPMAGMPITLTAKSMTQDLTGKGMRWQGILALYRWFLAHPSKEEIKAADAELPPLVRTALPIFDNLQGTGSIDGISVTTPIGPVAIDSASFSIGMNGVVENGMFQEGITLKGLHLPEGIVPPWAAPLVPKDAILHVKASDFNLAAPAKLLIDTAAAGPIPKGPEFDAKMAKAALPSGAVTISTDGVGVSGEGYDVTLTGNIKAGPGMTVPPMDLTITAKGYDKVLKSLDAAPPQIKQRAVPVMMMARGFAKPGAGGDLIWKIETSPEGHLLINGQDMGPMGRRKQ